MELLIILSLLVIFGIWLVRKGYDYDILGIIIIFLSGMYLVCHILIWSISSYSYEKFSIKRESLVETLEYSRENNNPIELAAVTKNIIHFFIKFSLF